MSGEAHPSGWALATIDLTLLSGAVEVRLRVPAGPCRFIDMLPPIQALTDLIAADAVRAATAVGRTVSCHKGCDHCCHILAFVAEVEARHLLRVVACMPEPRRRQVTERFWAARQTIEREGILDRLLRPLDRHALQQLMLDYERLGVSCPFLDEGTCSIYPDRPLICREVLVVSPPEFCAGPGHQRIECIPLAARPSLALLRLSGPAPRGGDRTVPLIVAPEWATQHPDDSPLRPGLEWLQDLLLRLKEPLPEGFGKP